MSQGGIETGVAARSPLLGFARSSRWDEDPVRLFETQEEAEEALRRVGEDPLGLAADAFVAAIEFSPDGPARRRLRLPTARAPISTSWDKRRTDAA
jgi:hypothetical protein